MKRNLVILITGICLTVFGGILFTISMSAHGWDFSTLSSLTVEYKNYESQSNQTNEIYLDFTIADIELNVYDGEKIAVEYPIYKNRKGENVTEVRIEDNERFALVENKDWKKNIFQINTPTAKVKLNIPRGLNLKVSLKTNTGDFSVGESGKDYIFPSVLIETDTGDVEFKSKITVDILKIETDTGDITVNEITAKNIEIETDTGKINFLEQVTASERLYAKTDTGKINFNGVKAETMEIKTSTGDVTSKNGKIDASKLTVKTSTGDVKIKLFGKKEDYSVQAETSTGDVNIGSYLSGEKKVDIKTSTGDIEVGFIE